MEPSVGDLSIFSREEVYSSARKAKAAAYPRKDSAGRLVNENFCVPFILTSMGGLCKEGHDFLRLCKKRNKGATLRLLDVLVAQHAKWTARRIRRALFGQSLLNFSGSSWSSVKIHKSTPEPTQVNRRKTNVSRMTREFSEAAAKKDVECVSSHNLVPHMSQYQDSDVNREFSKAGTLPGGVSLSTSAAHQVEHSQSLDWTQESIYSNEDFSPTGK